MAAVTFTFCVFYLETKSVCGFFSLTVNVGLYMCDIIMHYWHKKLGKRHFSKSVGVYQISLPQTLEERVYHVPSFKCQLIWGCFLLGAFR